MLYPLRFKPVYKEAIWGSNNIGRFFNKPIPFDKTAEDWSLCCRHDGMSIIDNGALQGESLSEVINKYKEDLLGEKVYARFGGEFPLLIKFIDAAERLSLQVHPDDDYARAHGENNGKNELWYIIDAKESAQIIHGLKKGTDKEKFESSINNGNLEDCLNYTQVKAGDSIFIKAGTVHAICEGILLAEIQQNSSTTYRVYDWGRVDKDGKGRQLHIKEALETIKFESQNDNKPVTVSELNGCSIKQLLRSVYFNLDEITVNGKYMSKTDGESFFALVIINGEGKITYKDTEAAIKAGETYLLPACLGEYEISGSVKLLSAYIG